MNKWTNEKITGHPLSPSQALANHWMHPIRSQYEEHSPFIMSSFQRMAFLHSFIHSLLFSWVCGRPFTPSIHSLPLLPLSSPSYHFPISLGTSPTPPSPTIYLSFPSLSYLSLSSLLSPLLSISLSSLLYPSYLPLITIPLPFYLPVYLCLLPPPSFTFDDDELTLLVVWFISPCFYPMWFTRAYRGHILEFEGVKDQQAGQVYIIVDVPPASLTMNQGEKTLKHTYLMSVDTSEDMCQRMFSDGEQGRCYLSNSRRRRITDDSF